MFIDAKILQLGYYFKVTVFWNVTWCNLVYKYPCCGGTFCLHFQGMKLLI